MNFSELSLTRPLLRAVREQGYDVPSPIQAKAIPPVLAGHDLLGCAQTGTGKTAAFALPMLQLLAAKRPNHRKVRALVLTPTRELALQIGESFAALGKYTSISHTVVFGGVGQAPQVAALQKGVDVLVACPGRLNDLIGQGLCDLSALEIFVLDEADRMLDMGFIHDVKKVIAKLPRQRQNLMFSATMPAEIEQLADSFLHRPVTVKVDPPSSTVDKIDQYLYRVSKSDKRRLLAWLLTEEGIPGALVFSRTKHGADRIARELNKAGITAAAIHGNKSQNARVAALEGFKAGSTRVLVATDIAARGIDINELSHVINFDLPEVPETYVHRIGRTARAGRSGVAISFCCPDEAEYLAGIEKLNRKRIPVVEIHPWAEGADAPAQPEPPTRLRRVAGEKTEKAARDKSIPAAAAKPAKTGNEEPIVEEKQKQTAPEGGKTEGLSASAKRRRRRHRAAQAAAAAAEGTAPQQTRQPAQPPKAKAEKAEKAERQPRAEKQSKPQNGRQPAKKQAEKPAQPSKAKAEKPEKQPKAQPARKAAEAARSERQAKPQRPAPLPRAKTARQQDEDPGLLLITRRPPAQKFASFEEYIQSHGGVTAPIIGDEEE